MKGEKTKFKFKLTCGCGREFEGQGRVFNIQMSNFTRHITHCPEATVAGAKLREWRDERLRHA